MDTKDYKQKYLLFYLYVTMEKSLRDVANICELKSPTTVLNWLRKFCIPPRNQGRPKEKHGRWKGGQKTFCWKEAKRTWEEYWREEIPDGYIIHHIDRNIANNEISNLALLTRTYHAKVHNVPFGGKQQCVQKN